MCVSMTVCVLLRSTLPQFFFFFYSICLFKVMHIILCFALKEFQLKHEALFQTVLIVLNDLLLQQRGVNSVQGSHGHSAKCRLQQ